MSKHNRFNNQKIEDRPVEAPVITEEEAIVLDEELCASKRTNVLGTVVNCNALNVRSTPDASDKNNIVAQLLCGTLVTIDPEQSTNDFYKITATLETSIDGFCMKKYIAE